MPALFVPGNAGNFKEVRWDEDCPLNNTSMITQIIKQAVDLSINMLSGPRPGLRNRPAVACSGRAAAAGFAGLVHGGHPGGAVGL